MILAAYLVSYDFFFHVPQMPIDFVVKAQACQGTWRWQGSDDTGIYCISRVLYTIANT